jgi:hypothetical protein
MSDLFVKLSPDLSTVEQYPYTLGQLRQDNPQVSFPPEPTDGVLADFSAATVRRVNPPTAGATQVLFEPGPAKINGTWVQQWALRDMTPAELAELAEEDARRAEAERAIPERLIPALEVVARALLDPEQLSPEDRAAVATLYPSWRPGVVYKEGEVISHAGVLIRVVQAHTSQADWNPLTTPALYAPFREPGQVTPWKQPTGAQDAYAIGDIVSHPNAQDGGAVWVFSSKIAANTTEPGTDSTFHRWWQPISLLSGYQP